MELEPTTAPVTTPWRGRIHRVLALGGLLLWIAVFVLIWIHSPPTVRVISILWAGLGAFAPQLYLLSLALALPFFGNNPGGPHHLYLLDTGLMGFVAHDLVLRVLGRRVVRPLPVNPLIRLFLLVSTIALIPQWRFFHCEAVSYRSAFFFQIFNHYANAPMYGMRAWLNLALAASMFAALRDAPLSMAWRRRFWGALIAALLAASLVGLFEFFGWISLEWWRPQNALIERFGYKRLQSLFWHSGWFAQYLGVLAPAILAVALTRVNPRSRRFAWGALALLILVQLLTMQRGGWLALAAGLIAVTGGAVHSMESARRRQFFVRFAIAAVCGAVGIGLLALVHAPFAHRMSEMMVFRDRTIIWSGGLEMVRWMPFSGVGIGNYSAVHYRWYTGDSIYATADDRTTAHNVYIHIAAERGIFALVLFMLILFGAIYLLLRQLRRENEEADPDFKAERLALLGGLVGLSVDGVFQYIFYMRITELLAWILLALTFSYGAELRYPWISRLGTRSWLVLALIIVGLMTWESRIAFRPWLMYSDGRNYSVARDVVKIELPPHAHHIVVPIFSFDPAMSSGKSVSYSFWCGGRLLATQVFRTIKGVDLAIELPANRNPKDPLIIRSSNMWNPYRVTNREIPLVQAGICYIEPTVID